MGYTPNEIYKHIDAFVDVDTSDVPDGVRLTVWCDNGGSEKGFLINKKSENLGLHALIVTKWILHKDLLKLLKPKK
jgi:hypothetical protein